MNMICTVLFGVSMMGYGFKNEKIKLLTIALVQTKYLCLGLDIWVTKVVKADRPEFVFLQKGLEVLRNKIGLIGYAQVIDVDVVAFSVAVSAQLSALFLAGFYPEFLFHSKRAVQVEQLEGDPSLVTSISPL